MGLNNTFVRAPLMFVLGGEGFYFFNLRRDGEPDSGQAAHYFPMSQIESISYNSAQGWTVIHTKEYLGKFEDDPKVKLNYL